jgi:hypothetical protein
MSKFAIGSSLAVGNPYAKTAAPVKTAYTPTPAGTYSACLVRVYDKGLFDKTGKRDDGTVYTTEQRDMVFEFELNKKRDGTDFNRTESINLTFSMSPKSNFTKIMDSWLGDDQPGIGEAYNFDALINHFALISIVPHTKQDGSKTTKVGAVMACPDAMKFTPTTKVSFFWSVESDPELQDDRVPERHIKGNQWFTGAENSKQHKAFLAKQKGDAFEAEANEVFGGSAAIDNDEDIVF